MTAEKQLDKLLQGMAEIINDAVMNRQHFEKSPDTVTADDRDKFRQIHMGNKEVGVKKMQQLSEFDPMLYAMNMPHWPSEKHPNGIGPASEYYGTQHPTYENMAKHGELLKKRAAELKEAEAVKEKVGYGSHGRDTNYGPGYDSRLEPTPDAPTWGEEDMKDMRNAEKSTNECAAKKSESSINDDLSVIFTQLDNMDYVFNELTEKLRPVIKPIPDSGINGCDAGPRPTNSPLSEQLKNISASIADLNGRIRFLTKSIDL
jgi:hypothetical protein